MAQQNNAPKLSKRRQRLLQAVLESQDGKSRSLHRHRPYGGGAAFCGILLTLFLLLIFSSFLYEYFF